MYVNSYSDVCAFPSLEMHVFSWLHTYANSGLALDFETCKQNKFRLLFICVPTSLRIISYVSIQMQLEGKIWILDKAFVNKAMFPSSVFKRTKYLLAQSIHDKSIKILCTSWGVHPVLFLMQYPKICLKLYVNGKIAIKSKTFRSLLLFKGLSGTPISEQESKTKQ